MDLLPRSVLVAVFPNGAPQLQDGLWSGGADLHRRGQAMLEEATDHEGVGFRVEGVELGGESGWLFGSGWVLGESEEEEEDGEERKRTISGKEKEDGSLGFWVSHRSKFHNFFFVFNYVFLFFIIFKIDKFIF